MTVNDTLGERGSKYGSYEEMAQISQQLKRVVTNYNGYHNLSDVQRESISMIFSKIARAISGDPNYVDNWHDIAGYATLVEKTLTSKQQSLTSAGSVDTMQGQ
jgi:hypothetical protein